VARAAAAALPASRSASVAAAHRTAALAQRRAARKREAAEADALPLCCAGPPAGALHGDALAVVLAALDPRSLARAACVCRAWRDASAAADAELWRPLLRRCFALTARRDAPTWREAFAAAAATRPEFDAPRLACRRCGALAWRAEVEAAARAPRSKRQRAHAWRGVCAERAAARTLRCHGLGASTSSDSDSDAAASSGGSGGSDGSDDDAAVSRQFKLWSLPRGVAALNLR
jgi:ribosomal protein L37E